MGLSRNGAAGSISAILRTNVLMQVLSLLSVPILTRIYGPEHYGLFALYVILSGYVTQCAILRFDVAIDIPKEDVDARALLHLCLVLVLGMAILSTAVTLLFGKQVGRLMGQEQLADLLMFLPLSVMLGSYGALVGVWFARQRDFQTPSNIRLLTALADIGAKVGLGASGALKLGQVLGSLSSVSAMVLLSHMSARKQQFRLFHGFSVRRALLMGWKYRRFPLMNFPATLLEMTAFAIPALMIGVYFGPSAVGLYFVADRLTQAPSVAIASAIRPVFKRHVALRMHAEGTSRPLVFKTLVLTGGIGAMTLLGLFVVTPLLFDFIFEAKWHDAVWMVQVLAFARAMDIVVNPVTPVLVVRQNHKINLAIQFLLVVGTAAAFALGGGMNNLQLAITGYSAVLCAKYFAELFFVIYFSDRGSLGI